MRDHDEREQEDVEIVRGLRRGEVDLRSQRAQRAVRSMHRAQREASIYSDPWIEEEEAAAARAAPPAPSRPRTPPRASKPLLTERQQNVVMETLFGQAAPAVQTALDMARSDTGQKVVAVGGLALGSMLLPLIGAIRR
jgi:DNA-binding transcriptional LysR family regulator